MDDLEKRLREVDTYLGWNGDGKITAAYSNTIHEAIAALDASEERVRVLREALGDIASWSLHHDALGKPVEDVFRIMHNHAHAALEQTQEDSTETLRRLREERDAEIIRAVEGSEQQEADSE